MPTTESFLSLEAHERLHELNEQLVSHYHSSQHPRRFILPISNLSVEGRNIFLHWLIGLHEQYQIGIEINSQQDLIVVFNYGDDRFTEDAQNIIAQAYQHLRHEYPAGITWTRYQPLGR